MLLRHVDGTPCWWDARPMYRDPKRNWDGKPLHADHSRTRAVHGTSGNQADRLMHDTCNKQRGDGSRDHLRPALNPGGIDTDPDAELLGPRPYFQWPA